MIWAPKVGMTSQLEQARDYRPRVIALFRIFACLVQVILIRADFREVEAE